MQQPAYLPDRPAETWHVPAVPACYARKHFLVMLSDAAGSATSMHLLCSSRPTVAANIETVSGFRWNFRNVISYFKK